MKTSTDLTSVAYDGDTLPMSVDEMGFLIDKLFDDCAPLQFLRELTKNSIEVQSSDTPTALAKSAGMLTGIGSN